VERYFILDLTENKLEVHTGGKSEWNALPESQRNDIKRQCLWSSRRGCWVSRVHGDRADVFLIPVLKAAGFADRGTKGEKRSFAEQVEAEQERAADRAERMEDRAATSAERSQAHGAAGHRMFDAIPFGQPILVGHYSESRDRNYRDRAGRQIDKSIAEAGKAEYYSRRAVTAQATADGAKFKDPAYLGNRIAECESRLRELNRMLEGRDFAFSEARPISDKRRESLNELTGEQQERLAFFQACLANCGRVIYSRETLAGKTEILLRGRWKPIVKLNSKTVAVPNTCFQTEESQRKWALKYAYTEVRDAR
jgi:hypothetical protein